MHAPIQGSTYDKIQIGNIFKMELDKKLNMKEEDSRRTFTSNWEQCVCVCVFWVKASQNFDLKFC